MQVESNSRKETLRWVNSLLELDLSTIQQLGTGSTYCQLLDCVRPGSVHMSKVNWKAKHQYEYISNFKVLQGALEHMGIGMKLDVQRLIKCKYQDNFEMIQQFRKLVQKYGTPDYYDPVVRRNLGVVQTGAKKASMGNKENTRRSSVLGSGSLTTKNSTSKKFQFPTPETPTVRKPMVPKSMKSFDRTFIPNKEISDQQKLAMIRSILEEGRTQQLDLIKRVVFESDQEDKGCKEEEDEEDELI